ncbi:MAG: response regulator [candidate division Zixibacteria bacterium]|nr:response regulator [candidate division Zixibacteria bacterium]
MGDYLIYVIEDDKTTREGIEASLSDEYYIKAFPSAENGLEAMEREVPDLVLLDIGLPGIGGVDAISKIKAIDNNIAIIMITGFDEVKTVVSAIRKGAYDYIIKPLKMDELEISIEKALETIKLRREVRALQERYLEENIPCFIAESDATQQVMEVVENVAQSPDTPVLIQGETGTGKELIASAIHYRSPNFNGPFVAVNCAAIPKDLIESELFGYAKGAFSGASAKGKKGRIEEAAKGTLFLDEIGDLSMEAQAKLLRFLEEGEITKLGSTEVKKIKTRIVTATNKNINELIKNDRFREDLYYRIAVIKVKVPSLNERPEDIIPLAKYYITHFNDKFNKQINEITPEAEEELRKHNWTGNVRELRNIVERAVLICRSERLDTEDFGLNESSDENSSGFDEGKLPKLTERGIDLASVQDNLEGLYIRQALKLADGNESKAAKLLNINHHTFRYRRKKLGIEVD